MISASDQRWPRFRAAGESAVLVEFGDAISEEVNRKIHGVADGLRASGKTGILDVVPAYAALLIHFDPRLIDIDEVLAAVADDTAHQAPAEPARRFELPVCYGDEFGPDLAGLAASHGLTTDDVIGRHTATEYRIYCIGFVAGFPFLGPLDPTLHTARRDTPRTRIPAGSVAIGGSQTGIYPVSAPGGWHIIGRSPLRLFDPSTDPPVKYRPGDYFRFQPVDESEFKRLDAAEATISDYA